MNRTFIKIILPLVLAFSNAGYSASMPSVAYDKAGGMKDRYILPSSKKFIQSCRQKTLLLHAGIIEKQKMLHRNGNFWLRYEIQASDGSEWLVLCDLATGEIVREQKLADDAS